MDFYFTQPVVSLNLPIKCSRIQTLHASKPPPGLNVFGPLQSRYITTDNMDSCWPTYLCAVKKAQIGHTHPCPASPDIVLVLCLFLLPPLCILSGKGSSSKLSKLAALVMLNFCVSSSATTLSSVGTVPSDAAFWMSNSTIPEREGGGGGERKRGERGGGEREGERERERGRESERERERRGSERIVQHENTTLRALDINQ